MEDDMTDLAPLMLVTGEDEGADEDGMVTLSSVGAGEIMYSSTLASWWPPGENDTWICRVFPI